jgi:hypothetical protein
MPQKKWAVVLVACLAFAAGSRDQTPDEYKPLEKMTVKLFEAYNKDDAKGVLADYVSAFKSLDADQLYKSLFKDRYKTKLGNFKSLTFQKEGSVYTDEVVLARFDGVFANKKAQIIVNFTKEDGKFKFQQVTIMDE